MPIILNEEEVQVGRVGRWSSVFVNWFVTAVMNSGFRDDDVGPFNGNTRIVAIIALTVAGVFVFLGLILSLLRAIQQRAAERALAAVLQQMLAQSPTVQEKHVERAHSSKVPWLVVSPDGVCSVAHKLSVAPTDTSNDDAKHGKQLATKERAPASLTMTTSTAGLLANMHENIAQQPSNADSVYDTIHAFHGDSSSYAVSQPSQSQWAHNPESNSSVFPALSGESATQVSTAHQRQDSNTDNSQRHRPWFTASVETG
ncbi:hypothetical protein ABBQ38_014331 [Trebouxia sp. C0009 RCD-2024]